MTIATTHNEYALRLKTEAAKRLIADMKDQNGADIFDGDNEFLVDTVEGETGLIEAIEAALKSRDEDLILLTGLDARIEELKVRAARLKATAERKKSIVERAMIAAEIKSLPLPTATLTISNRAPGLCIVEESDIPTKYWVEPPKPAPTVDKKLLTADLRAAKAGLDAAMEAATAIEDEEGRTAAIAAAKLLFPAIKGAELDNGSVSLSIRVK